MRILYRFNHGRAAQRLFSQHRFERAFGLLHMRASRNALCQAMGLPSDTLKRINAVPDTWLNRMQD